MKKRKIEQFAKKIRELRNGMDLSQAELAVKAGVSNITISKIESGENGNPTIKTLKSVAKILKVPVIDLIK